MSSTALLTVGVSGSQSSSWSLLDLVFRISSAPLAKSCNFCDPRLTPGLEYVYIWSRERTGYSRATSTHQAGGGNIRHGSSPDVSAGHLEHLRLPAFEPAKQRLLAAQFMLVWLGSWMKARLLSEDCFSLCQHGGPLLCLPLLSGPLNFQQNVP